MTNEQLVVRIKAKEDIENNMLQLWEQCKRFISMIAKRYQGLAELEDLEQEGYMALYDAIDGFDIDYGYKFLTYAEYYIKQRMVRYIQNNNIVRISVHEGENIRKYNSFVNSYRMQYGKDPKKKEIAKATGLSIEEIDGCIKAAKFKRLKSLDEYATQDDEDISIKDVIPADVDIENDVLGVVEHEQLSSVIWNVVDTLPDQESRVLKQRYKENKTLKAIGDDLGVSQEKIRQLENKAMRNIRCSKNARVLHPFIYDLDCLAYNHVGVEKYQRTGISATELAVFKMINNDCVIN